MPIDVVPLTDLPDSHRAIKYVTDRGVTERDMWRWRLMWIASGEHRNRVLFPSFDGNGVLNFWTARAVGDWRPKYVNPDVPANSIIFGEIDVNFGESVVVCEGPFDAIKCGDSAIPLLGSTLDESHSLFDAIVKSDSTVIIMLDADAKKKALKIAMLLASYDVKVKIGSPSPDPGDMTHAACAAEILKAPILTWQSLQRAKIDIVMS